MKKILALAIITLPILGSCGNEADRTGNVNDTALTAPAQGDNQPGGMQSGGAQSGSDSLSAGQQNPNEPKPSLTDTSYRIGDSIK